MARYKVILAYDGTKFHGSQRQKETRTVQSVVEDALQKLNWPGRSVMFSGRTDAGVHAARQVIAFDLDWKHPPVKLRNAINSLLPEDAAVKQVDEVDSDFHPRYDAVARSYRYRIYCHPSRDPLRDRYYWRVWPQPNFQLLVDAVSAYIGIHDFASFGGPTSPGGSTIREVMKANWQQADDELYFEVTANAFLYHMVRRLAFAAIAVGQEKITVADIRRYLQTPRSSTIQGLAPPQGLALIQVHYSDQTGDEITK